MTFQEIAQQAKNIKVAYKKYNRAKGNKPWNVAEYSQGFVGDVGDLAKLIMAKNGYRNINDVDIKIAHELADCLWSLIVIADELNIDLEKEFVKTMDELKKRIT